MSESKEVRDRSSDEDMIRYSISKGEGDPAPTAPLTAPDREGGGRKKKRRRKKNKGPGAGSGGGHHPQPPPPAGGGSAGNGSRLETSYLVNSLIYIFCYRYIYIYCRSVTI